MPTIDTADANFLSDFDNLSWQVRQFCDALKDYCDGEPVITRHVQQLETAMQRMESWIRPETADQSEIDALERMYTGRKRRGPRVISI